MWGGMVRLERGVPYVLSYVLPYVLLYVLLYVLPAGNVVGSCGGRWWRERVIDRLLWVEVELHHRAIYDPRPSHRCVRGSGTEAGVEKSEPLSQDDVAWHES